MKKSGACKDNPVERMKHVDPALVEKAVSALIKYHREMVEKRKKEASSTSLLGCDQTIQVLINLEVAPGQARRVVRIDIPNSIYQTSNMNADDVVLKEPDICMIVKDESKPWIQEMVKEHKALMGSVKKVLTLDSLRKKHGRFQQRRELLQKYDIFMADDRILPMLTSCLGKDFVQARKLPLPITITRKVALPLAIQKNLSSTYMTISRGTSVMIRAGSTDMHQKNLVENVVAIAENAVSKIAHHWANVRNIGLKTPKSAWLPVYHKLPKDVVDVANPAGVLLAFKSSKNDSSRSLEDVDKSFSESQKRKRHLAAAKSPLVRAFKRQKGKTNEDGKAKARKSKKGVTSGKVDTGFQSQHSKETEKRKDKIVVNK